MCGIAGILQLNDGGYAESRRNSAGRMTSSLLHRGPDDSGIWEDRDVVLVHRRLSILDISPAGHQPMHSASGRYVVVFNGEIYNYREVRAELDALAPRNWRGHSDTEVMLEAFTAWGVDEAVRRFTGMFAIALWDRQERLLHLVRDRIGEKPLYYGWCGTVFLFGSELKALKAHPEFSAGIDRNALALFIRHSYIPAPYTIYKGVYKLSPGSIITINANSPDGAHTVSRQYWSARETAMNGIGNPFRGTAGEAVSALETLLLGTVSRQMVADVPLGAFLSGGVDSSAIVALMQAQSSTPVRTFTIGFHEERYDEAVYARDVARHLGTSHTEWYVSPQDALNLIPRLPELYDEPFADSSQIPTFLVSHMTRQHVTVSLSGDAGDELFGGYNRYTWGESIWNTVGWLPKSIRSGSARAIRSISPNVWNNVFNDIAPLLPARLRLRLPGDKLHKLATVLDVTSPAEMYRRLTSIWQDPSSVVVGAVEPPTALTDESRWLATDDIVQQMMYLDLVTYLTDDILVKVDRAAMGVSLETRVPFLDHSVVEFAWKLPLAMKIGDGQGKWALRQVLYKYVPKELIERPKMGFGIPIDAWLRGPLRGWAESLLDGQRLRREGYFNPLPIHDIWHEHLTGRRNWQHQLWNVLMFQAWLDNERSEGVA